MAYLGEYQLGEWVSIPLVTRAANGTETTADAAPTLSIYKADDTPITGANDLTVAPFAQGAATGFFNVDFQLDSNFSAGRYLCILEYAVSASAKSDVHVFEVVGGGNANGCYVAMFYYHRPHADYIVGQLDDGTLEFRRGPKI